VSGTTPYVRLGDWVAYGSVAVLVGAAVVVLARRRRQSAHASTPV
jgi:apolipoprotein N-acyltransferase